MLRFFVICAEIVLLVIVLRSPFVQYFFSDIQSTVSGWFVSISELPEQRELDTLRNQAAAQLAPLKEFEANYLRRILASRSTVTRFHSAYCETTDINPNFSRDNRKQLCTLIEQSKLLEPDK
ncbi:conserved hypothetical protein [Alteromonas sp. 38]|uniref:hypothetical protein n=1 Tax=Alteromonas TaxID=226 RepID=UPI0012F3A681|nr:MULTISPECIES: hypothetical protein [Alteromonas]CAD5291381.1 conserved hypothetical protein [Alteromonas sp. 154]VXB20869.1 conserved hypothetical protein [Alteromonas sp. 38]